MRATIRSRRRIGQVGVSLVGALALLPFVRPALFWLLSSDALVSVALGVLYQPPTGGTPEGPHRAVYSLAKAHPVARVDRRFLSVALDTSLVAGGHWWSADGRVELPVGTTRVAPFNVSRPQLTRLARALAPAYLRVGGTEADNLYYGSGPTPGPAPPPGYDLVLERHQWDALHAFAADAGLALMFTANAGPGPRDATGAWQPDSLEPLLAYSAARGYRVPVWELGNEVNAYWLTHGLSHAVSARQYARDVERFAAAVHRHYPDARIAAGAVFVWPIMGEAPPRLTEGYLRHSHTPPDIVTWHYYPQQSRRCLSATRRASAARMLEPRFLDEFAEHAAIFGRLARVAGAGGREPQAWLGETGGAQCGGEPRVSDRFASSLWWLDQLGLAARTGQRVVVRQALAGGDYGLLDVKTLAPRPDYWASLLWKRLMGPHVLGLKAERGNPHLRAYAHCHPDGAGRATLLAINLARAHAIQVSLPELAAGGAVRRVAAASLTAQTVELNGAPIALQDDGALPELPADLLGPGEALTLSPLSYAFAVLGDVPACR